MKLQKLEEMHHAAALEELAPLFTSGADRSKDELIFILAAHVRQICEALGVPVDPRLAEDWVVDCDLRWDPSRRCWVDSDGHSHDGARFEAELRGRS